MLLLDGSAALSSATASTSRRVLRWSLAVVAAGLVALTATAGEAAATGKIAYECRPNLCVVDPDTGATARVTTDGSEDSFYRQPSLSADGRRLAAIRGIDVLVGSSTGNLSERWTGSRDINDAALSPDGSAVAESHSYVETRYGCPLTGGCLQLVDRSGASYSVGVAGDGNTTGYRGGGGVGFLGDGSLLTVFYTIGDDTHTICVVPTPVITDGPCAADVAEVGTTLSSPAGSPDSRLIAAVATPEPEGSDPVINLYDARTGAKLRQLVVGGAPSFSPDGREVAYQGTDGWIHVIPVEGGKSRKLVAGFAPTWAGGVPPGPAVAAKALRYKRGSIRVPIRCAGTSPCKGRITLKKRRVKLGSRRYSVKPGRRATVKVKPSRRGRATLAKARRHKVAVRLKPRGGRAATKRLTLRR